MFVIVVVFGVLSVFDVKFSVKKIFWRFYDNLWNLLDVIFFFGYFVDVFEEMVDVVKFINMV